MRTHKIPPPLLKYKVGALRQSHVLHSLVDVSYATTTLNGPDCEHVCLGGDADAARLLHWGSQVLQRNTQMGAFTQAKAVKPNTLRAMRALEQSQTPAIAKTGNCGHNHLLARAGWGC